MNKIISKLLLFLFLIFNSIIVLAQSEYKKGALIKHDGDTVIGLIKYKGKIGNSQTCIYKTYEEANTETYEANDLKGYYFINGEHYLSKTLNNNETYFLEILVDGVTDLYFQRTKDEEKYYVEEPNGTLYLLENNKEEIVDQYRNIKIREDKKYIGTLNALFQDSPNTLKNIPETTLSHSSLIKISKQYHQNTCSEYECIVYEKQKEKSSLSFGLALKTGMLGLITSETFEGSESYKNDINFEMVFTPAFGFFTGLSIPYIHENFKIQYQLTYSQVELKSNAETIKNSLNTSTINDISLSFGSINNSFDFVQTLPRQKYNYILLLGAFYNIHIQKEYERNESISYLNGNGEIVDENIYIDDAFQNNDIGLNLGIGISKNFNKTSLSFVLGYQKGFGFENSFSSNYIYGGLYFGLFN